MSFYVMTIIWSTVLGSPTSENMFIFTTDFMQCLYLSFCMVPADCLYSFKFTMIVNLLFSVEE